MRIVGRMDRSMEDENLQLDSLTTLFILPCLEIQQKATILTLQLQQQQTL